MQRYAYVYGNVYHLTSAAFATKVLALDPSPNDFLDVLHELEESNRVLDVAFGVHDSGWPCDASAEKTRQLLQFALATVAGVLEMSILVVKDRLNSPAFARLERGNRIAAVANGLHVEVCAGQVLLVGLLFSSRFVGHFGDVLGHVAVGRRVRLKVLARPLGCFAFETSVVAKDPAVALLGVAQLVAGEPGDAQVGFACAGQIVEVHKDEDGGVGGADDGD